MWSMGKMDNPSLSVDQSISYVVPSGNHPLTWPGGTYWKGRKLLSCRLSAFDASRNAKWVSPFYSTFWCIVLTFVCRTRGVHLYRLLRPEVGSWPSICRRISL